MRGGKRPGAGRKPAPSRQAITVRVTPETAKRFADHCKASNKSQSRVFAELVDLLANSVIRCHSDERQGSDSRLLADFIMLPRHDDLSNPPDYCELRDDYWALWDGAANADITSRIEDTRKIMYSRTVGLTIEESDKLRTWIDATLSVLANSGVRCHSAERIR